MNMKTIAISLWTAIFLLSACGPSRSPEATDTSKLASLAVGDYVPAQGLPAWTELNVRFDQLTPKQDRFEKNFPKSAFGQGKRQREAEGAAGA